MPQKLRNLNSKQRRGAKRKARKMVIANASYIANPLGTVKIDLEPKALEPNDHEPCDCGVECPKQCPDCGQ